MSSSTEKVDSKANENNPNGAVPAPTTTQKPEAPPQTQATTNPTSSSTGAPSAATVKKKPAPLMRSNDPSRKKKGPNNPMKAPAYYPAPPHPYMYGPPMGMPPPQGMPPPPKGSQYAVPPPPYGYGHPYAIHPYYPYGPPPYPMPNANSRPKGNNNKKLKKKPGLKNVKQPPYHQQPNPSMPPVKRELVPVSDQTSAKTPSQPPSTLPMGAKALPPSAEATPDTQMPLRLENPAATGSAPNSNMKLPPPITGSIPMDMKEPAWSKEEENKLRRLVDEHGTKNWEKVSKTLGTGRSEEECTLRWHRAIKPSLVKGPWTDEEDKRLMDLVKEYGPKRWTQISEQLPGRNGKQCRERWHNHLNPAITKQAWKAEEDRTILECHVSMGNKWAGIAKYLPGR